MRTTNLKITVLAIIFFVGITSFSKDKNDKNNNGFNCDYYWEKVNLNSICDLDFPSSFTFDAPPKAGATIICQANMLANSGIGYNEIILIIKTPSADNAINSFETEKAAVHSYHTVLDFDGGGDRGYVIEMNGNPTDLIYRVQKGQYIVKYTCKVNPALHSCLTRANHEAYVQALVSKL